jgi:hypothetical protein
METITINKCKLSKRHSTTKTSGKELNIICVDLTRIIKLQIQSHRLMDKEYIMEMRRFNQINRATYT